MNVLSDFESSDSEKIRYKTESTRYKKKKKKKKNKNKNKKNEKEQQHQQPDVRNRNEKDLVDSNSSCYSKSEIRNKDKEDKHANRYAYHTSSFRSDCHDKQVGSSSSHEKSRSRDIDDKKDYGEKNKKYRKEKLRANDDCSSNEVNFEGLRNEETQFNMNSQHMQSDTNESLICGPSLPPHMQKIKDDIDSVHNLTQISTNRIYGPTLYSTDMANNENSPLLGDKNNRPNSEDENIIGPILEHTSNQNETYLKLEKRALELKLAKLNENERKSVHQEREEWMLSLPELRTVSDLGVTARQFKTKVDDEIKDRSLWTETPHDREDKVKKRNPPHDKINSEKIEKMKRERRDAEQEDMVRKHKKKHKRDESLLEMHQKNMKKNSEKKSVSTERRPFSRDTDLKTSNLFDDNMKKSVLKKAQLLNTRFKSGQSKFL
ncbi:GPALPP motifs-containing protein 1 [Sitodiplosis mosellana]|uniref:GPALPP motifs-containing protein 1 n=1 Tax=Sitodiplosis mosellana TaxID=263140 RepID=UPI00244528BF|nr:GPALPP motifs-containing protein 1 [Sitodiplosis mosellana]